MKSSNMKVTLALIMSSVLAPASALADDITWTITSSGMAPRGGNPSGSISGSFVWSTNGGLLSNNVLLTVFGVPYSGLVEGLAGGSYLRLFVSNTSNSLGVFLTSTGFNVAGTISSLAVYGNCVIQSTVCDGMTGLGFGNISLSGVVSIAPRTVE